MKNNNERIIHVDVGGKRYIVCVKRSQSRYWRLSVGKFDRDLKDYLIKVSSPRKLSDLEVAKIIIDHRGFIEKQIAKKQKQVILKDDEAMLHGKIVTIEEFNKRFSDEIDYIINRYYALAKLAKVDGIKLTFRKMKSRWGSYNKTKKTITLNKWLVVLPYDLIDYVICHELTHHYVFNHSKDFYNHLAKLYPDYIGARKAIKNYSDIV